MDNKELVRKLSVELNRLERRVTVLEKIKVGGLEERVIEVEKKQLKHAENTICGKIL